MSVKRVIPLFLFIAVLSCQQDDHNMNIYVHPDLEPYWNQFILEAESRGVDLRLDTISLIMDFAPIESSGEQSPLGTCNSIPGERVHINRVKWKDYNDRIREHLVFHELGHCILGRYHTIEPTSVQTLMDEINLRTYTCPSLMTGLIHGVDCGIDYYSDMWRTYYIDELFRIKNKPDFLETGLSLESIGLTSEPVISEQDIRLTSYLLPDSLDGKNYQLDIDLRDRYGFDMMKDDLIFRYHRVIKTLTIHDSGEIVFNPGSIMRFLWDRDEVGDDTPFTYLHKEGIDYFYLNNTLIHSREGTTSFQNLEMNFEGSVFMNITVRSE